MSSIRGTASKRTRALDQGKHAAKAVREPYRVYLVSLSSHELPQARGEGKAVTRRIQTKQALLKAFENANRQSVWVASRSDALSPLATHSPAASGEQRLLVLEGMQEVTHHLYSALFRYVVTASDQLKLLKASELIEVLAAPNRDELFIGGAVDEERRAVLLYRGNVEPIVVPLDWFRNKASKAVPDPAAFGVTDFGQTVRLGDFEASAEAILYEFDADYRRLVKKRTLEKDSSLGASIRRLRLQKGLARQDFPGISEKAIARIERNEVRRPHVRTLRVIASRLGVPVDELRTF